MSSAIYGRVTNIKAFTSTGLARVEIEIPVEAYPAAVNGFFSRDVLVTVAPALGGQYGVMVGRTPEQPAACVPEQKDKPEVVPKDKKSGEHALSQWAAIRCGDEQFQKFLDTIVELGVEDEETAREAILFVCGIKSRAELDSNDAAAQRFHKMIREPYARWCNGR